MQRKRFWGGSGHPEATGSGGRPGERPDGGLGLKETRDSGADALPRAERIWRPADGPGEAAQGGVEREHSAEATARRC